MHVTIFKRVSCVVVNYGVYHFKSRWLETVDRFGHSELLPGTKIFVRTIFLFTGEVIYCLIVKTHFKRPSLCDYQFIIIRFHFFETRTSSCHNFKEAKANGGSPQLSSPSYSPIIVPFRRVGGNLVMKLTHKGDRERPSKSLGSGEHLATLRSHWTLTDGLPA